MKQIAPDFFTQADTLWLARQLLGKLLITRFEGLETIGRIVETEAYLGETDRASHAFGGRRTARTEVMYLPGGHAYVYLCYGMHHLFNIVTHQANIPHAILIRALEPLAGIPHMLQRRNKIREDHTLTRGPGSLSQAMGLHTRHSGLLLDSHELLVAEDGCSYLPDKIMADTRIGVEYAGEDARLPYRFSVKENPWVSKRSKKG